MDQRAIPRAASLQRFEGLRELSDGSSVYWRRWDPPDGHKGVICLIHGLGEHCGRYDHVAAQFGAAGYATCGFDLRGFGKSPGRRGHLRLTGALRDVDEILRAERAQSAGIPLFLYGHSLGGLLVMLYALEYRPDLAGVVATGPALHTVLRNQPVKVFTAKTLGALFPAVTLPSGLDDTKLNRDPKVLSAYRADPLVHDRLSLGLARDSLRAMDRVLRGAPRFPLPLLLLHGGADQVNLVSGSRSFAARCRGDFTLKIYPGVFHAVEHEPESVDIVNDAIQWLDRHQRHSLGNP